jgi:hypothetical protein
VPFTERAHLEPVSTTSQVAAPWKATVRTLLAVIPGIALLVDPVLDAVANGDGSTLGGWAVLATGVAGAITRVLALPGVEAFLRRFAPWLAAGATNPLARPFTE